MISGHWRHLVFLIGVLACPAGRAVAGDAFSISAPAFGTGKPMPTRCAFSDANVSPELRLANVPIRARSLVLIVDDPDAPSGLWTHWLVWNLSSATTVIPEGKLPPEAVEGKNSFGNVQYDGPAPPSGTHRYFFHLYALDTKLTLPAGSDRDALKAVMEGHVVGKAETFGTYGHGT
jgi:Raf kinase inhibitor-like YbhB/YbcL family protein